MNIYDETIGVLKDLHINIKEATNETRLKEDLEMDSTELIETAVALEKHFAISIDDAALSQLFTLGEIVQLVQSSLESQSIRGK